MLVRVLRYCTGTATASPARPSPVQCAPRHCLAAAPVVPCSYPLSLWLARSLARCPSGLSPLVSGLWSGARNPRHRIGLCRYGWAGLGLALATLHDWTPWPVRTSRVPPHSFSRCSKDTLSVSSLLPILLLLLHPRCRPLTNLLPQEPRSIQTPADICCCRLALPSASSSFYFPRPLFFAPFIPLSSRPACSSHLCSTNNPVASRPLVFEFSTTQARNTRRPSVSNHRPRRV